MSARRIYHFNDEAEREIDPGTNRTVRRLERLRTALERRQTDLHLVLENVHDPHNVSAVLRTCDAIGIDTVHLVYSEGKFPRLSKASSTGALKWLELISHNSIDDCYRQLRQEGCAIISTYLGPDTRDLYAIDYRLPTAIVFGNENKGISEEAMKGSDATISIPMVGLVTSLNISVACAVTLYEAFRQRRAAGLYDHPTMTPEAIDQRLVEWAERKS